MHGEYMTIGEAAEALGVSRGTVWRRIKAGELDVFQSQADRRERLVRRADIEAMLRPSLVERITRPETGKAAA